MEKERANLPNKVKRGENMKWNEFYYNAPKLTMRDRLEVTPEELSVVTDEDILAWVNELKDDESGEDS